MSWGTDFMAEKIERDQKYYESVIKPRAQKRKQALKKEFPTLTVEDFKKMDFVIEWGTDDQVKRKVRRIIRAHAKKDRRAEAE